MGRERRCGTPGKKMELGRESWCLGWWLCRPRLTMDGLVLVILLGISIILRALGNFESTL